MAQKEAVKILCEDLLPAEKAMLLQVINTPGWKVVEKIANAACLRATQDTIKLDPESEDYERVCVERQRRARNITEFSDLLMRSIYEHAKTIRIVEKKEEEAAVDRVASMFGIHSANPQDQGKSSDAIKRQFGIHPRRPKTVKSPAEGKQ
jgi:hypothetical protein